MTITLGEKNCAILSRTEDAITCDPMESFPGTARTVQVKVIQFCIFVVQGKSLLIIKFTWVVSLAGRYFDIQYIEKTSFFKKKICLCCLFFLSDLLILTKTSNLYYICLCFKISNLQEENILTLFHFLFYFYWKIPSCKGDHYCYTNNFENTEWP